MEAPFEEYLGNIKITRAKCINELLFFEKSLRINQYIIRYCSFAIIDLVCRTNM
jgi:hypothetical protein